jgi:hypothetical protein
MTAYAIVKAVSVAATGFSVGDTPPDRLPT